MSAARRIACGLLLAAALVQAARLPLPAFVVAPGLAVPAGRYVRVEGGAAAGADILLTTVVARPARAGDAVVAALRPEEALLPRSALLGPGGSLEEYARAGERALRASQQVAAYVALRYLGRPARLEPAPEGPRLRADVAVRFAPLPVAGPSAGLAFALEVVRQLGGLVPAVPVAATGALRADGRVEPVGAIPFKVRAAERAGARLLLVPSAQAEAARRAARSARVVGVADFAGAVAAALTSSPGGPYNSDSLEGRAP